MERDATRVAVTCAQPLFRQAIISLLRERWPQWHFLASTDPHQLADELGQNAGRTLLVVELDLSATPALAWLTRMRAEHPELLVMVLGDTTHFPVIWECIALGVRAYLCKSASPAQLIQAVETILADGIFAPADLVATQPPRPVSEPSPPRARAAEQAFPVALTARQREVFQLLAEGCSTKSIARRLNLSVGTVKIHLAGIYRLLGAHSRIEALVKARNCTPAPAFPVGPSTPATPHSARLELNWCAA